MTLQPLTTMDKVQVYSQDINTTAPTTAALLTELVNCSHGVLANLAGCSSFDDAIAENGGVVPRDLDTAAAVWVIDIYHRLQRIGIKSETFNTVDITYETINAGLPYIVESTINRYNQQSLIG